MNKKAPLSEKQNELVSVLGTCTGSYIGKFHKLGYWLMYDGNAQQHVSEATINALVRKRIVKLQNEKYVLCQSH